MDDINGEPLRGPVPMASGGLPPFEPPTLSKYKDMQDMLLLDPVHDVEEAGWPEPK